MRSDLQQECGCDLDCLTKLRSSIGDSVTAVYNLREARFAGTHHSHNAP